jgi:hypothetical protein
MVDRQKLEALLSKRFPGSKHDQIAAAANAIMGLDDDWEEVVDSAETPRMPDAGVEYRVLRRRS